MSIVRRLRSILHVGLPVALAAILVSLAVIDVVLVKSSPDVTNNGLWPPEVGGLYYSLALVGIVALVVGTSVKLRRPNDPATLHFFWLVVGFFCALAFRPTGLFDHLDAFFDWAGAIGVLILPPLFTHFALVFPERAHPWVRSPSGRATVPVFYLPAIGLGLWRAAIVLHGYRRPAVHDLLARVGVVEDVYLAAALIAGLALMVRALTRVRSVTARRQLRWIVWGSTVGAMPFGALYVMPVLVGYTPPYAEYTAVLLGGIPLAFASAIVRYRLMDVEVIIKRAMAVAAATLLLGLIYLGTLQLVGLLGGPDQEQRNNSFWALFATLVVALLAPRLWRAIQGGLDRLYYRDRYDYRRALVAFARDLNSDLDLARLGTRLVTRVQETLAVDRLALYLLETVHGTEQLAAVAMGGAPVSSGPAVLSGSALGLRMAAGQMAVVDDPQPHRRLAGDEAAVWRAAGFHVFVPCVSNGVTIAMLALGRRAEGEPLSSEDLTLLGAVAAQAATALENARLYRQLGDKAHELDQLRQFSDSVVESLNDGLVVVDLGDRVLRWNQRMEGMIGLKRAEATGLRLDQIFSKAFLDAISAVRRDSPGGTTLHRLPVGSRDDVRSWLVNAGVSPFQTSDGRQAGWILVLEDITDRVNLEEQLQLSEKMAAIGLLAAGVAHEVNTPLTGISSFTQMLLDRADPADPRTQLLEKIERQTFRAAKIVNSLLNLARPTGAEAGPVDINGVIGDVLSLLEHQFRSGRIQVRKELASPGIIVRGVEYKLQQVFLNLFLNARDAMPKGGWLSIATRVEAHQAVVEVGDTGAGIPAEHMSRIYDPFFTTKPEGRGTGLGLSVTYGIVQEHGGTLTCTSDIGQGTRFRLDLPLADRPSVEAM